MIYQPVVQILLSEIIWDNPSLPPVGLRINCFPTMCVHEKIKSLQFPYAKLTKIGVVGKDLKAMTSGVLIHSVTGDWVSVISLC